MISFNKSKRNLKCYTLKILDVSISVLDRCLSISVFYIQYIHLIVVIFITVQEKIDILNERLERECYGSGERSLPPGDLTDYPETKNLSKQKCKTSQ